jgi:hypothetical protein
MDAPSPSRWFSWLVKLAQASPPSVERVYGYDPEDGERAYRKIEEMVKRRKELEQSKGATEQPSQAPAQVKATKPPEAD